MCWRFCLNPPAFLYPRRLRQKERESERERERERDRETEKAISTVHHLSQVRSSHLLRDVGTIATLVGLGSALVEDDGNSNANENDGNGNVEDVEVDVGRGHDVNGLLKLLHGVGHRVVAPELVGRTNEVALASKDKEAGSNAGCREAELCVGRGHG